MDDALLRQLEQRLGSLHARERLQLETDHEAQIFGQGLTFFHLENWYSAASIIRTALRLTGLYHRARREADLLQLQRRNLAFSNLPASFDGFVILHISDLHVELSAGAMQHLVELLPGLDYDLCVLTGDYRGKTFGPFEPSMAGVERMRAQLRGPVFAVLGNHDSIQMVPRLEAMGIRVQLNEADVIERGNQRIHLAGVDDAHFYRADDIARSAAAIPRDEFSVLLSHTPEIYRQAAEAGFDLMLSGHTHGGQLCLPGSIPIKLEAALPRCRAGSAPASGSLKP